MQLNIESLSDVGLVSAVQSLSFAIVIHLIFLALHR